MKPSFDDLIREKIILLDGATGTNLLKRGMPGGTCAEAWILEHPDVLTALQQEYIAAGSDVIYAPTFGANRIKLKEYGLADRVIEMNRELIRLSKQAAKDQALVAGDMTMTGQQLLPLGMMELDELIECYKEQAQAIDEAGADLFIVETMMSLQETRAAVLAIRSVSALPIMVTMTFEENGKTLYGTDPLTALITLQSLGIKAFGINCSSGPEKLYELLAGIQSYAAIPLIAKANAGLPRLENGETIFPMGPDEYAMQAVKLLDAGAVLIGGCCGTTPEHIRQLADLTRLHIPNLPQGRVGMAATTQRRTWFFDDNGQKPKTDWTLDAGQNEEFYEALADEDWDTVIELFADVIDKAPDVVGICVDHEGLSGTDVMKKIWLELPQSDCPLALKSMNLSTLEAGLIHYPGKVLVAISAAEPSMQGQFRILAGRFGADVIDRMGDE